MSSAALILWALAALAALAAWRQGGGALAGGVRFAGLQLRTIVPVLALALPAAGFIAALVPDDLARAWIGPDSGARGIVIAAFAGGLIPGGPFVSFPLVLAFAKSGAGFAQLVALTSGWAVFAFHRVLVWEWPVMGGRFVAVRMLCSLALPAASGFAAQALVGLGLFQGRVLP
jgi:uncharacterized membrane protein YraQ (UPF0718 family)